MKYIISRMLLLINSIIITVPIENTYNTIDNTYNTIDNTYNDFDTNNTNTNSNDSSEYQEYITTYQEYSISTNICMFISTLLQFIIFLYTVFVFGVIIKEVNTNKWCKKGIEILIQMSFWILLTLLLIIPIKYPDFWVNLLCLIVFLFFYFLFVFVGFYMCKLFPLFFIDKNIQVKPFKKLKEIDVNTIKFDDLKDEEFYIVLSIVLVVLVVLSIVSRIITFWKEKEVMDQFNNSTIMRYILRNINNKFNNIFKLPIASTNITLSESIFSLLLSSLTFSITFINHILPEKDALVKELSDLQSKYDNEFKKKVEYVINNKGNASDLIKRIEELKKQYDPRVEDILIKIEKYAVGKYAVSKIFVI